MNKRMILASLVISGAMLLSVATARATEGAAKLESSQVSCDVTSIWQEDRYRIIGKCNGLVYPYETKYEHYYLWARNIESGNMVRIGAIDKGYVDGSTNDDFNQLLITAEQNTSPRRPSDRNIVSGDMVGFLTSTGDTEGTLEELSVTDSPDVITVQRGVADETSTESGSGVGSVLGRIFSALLTVILIVIALVVVGSLIFRRRGSVNN